MQRRFHPTSIAPAFAVTFPFTHSILPRKQRPFSTTPCFQVSVGLLVLPVAERHSLSVYFSTVGIGKYQTKTSSPQRRYERIAVGISSPELVLVLVKIGDGMTPPRCSCMGTATCTCVSLLHVVSGVCNHKKGKSI